MTQRPDDIFGSGDDLRDDDPPLGRRDDRRPRVSDFVRRAIENTMGSVQSGGNAPREALEFLLRQGDRGRRELFRIVASEVNDFLKHVDVAGEVVKVLTSVEVELKANLRFKPSESALRVEPTPDSSVAVNLAPAGGASSLAPEPPRPPERTTSPPPKPRPTGEFDTEEPR